MVKKVISVVLSLFMCFSMTGCKIGKESPLLQIKKGVSFELLDALRVDNATNNTVYYYFLGNVKNKTKSAFPMNELEYEITDKENEKIHAIDSNEVKIVQELQPDQSTFIYGYVGYPNNNQENMGISFPKFDKFLPFSSVDVREIDDDNVKHSDSKKFTLCEDDLFKCQVDASNLKYSFENGNSVVRGLKVTYQNKTDQQLVVPYLIPKGTLSGLDLNLYSNLGDFSNMSLEEVKKVKFKKVGKQLRTVHRESMTTGYECFYLDKKQSITCEIGFIFEKCIPDFKKHDPKAITIDLSSASLGYSNTIQVDY